MDKAVLLQLAARCEAASEGSEALDLAIMQAVTGRPIATAGRQTYTPYTRSVDCAIGLVAVGHAWTLGWTSIRSTACVGKDGVPGGAIQCDAATPALALAAAALRALAA